MFVCFSSIFPSLDVDLIDRTRILVSTCIKSQYTLRSLLECPVCSKHDIEKENAWKAYLQYNLSREEDKHCKASLKQGCFIWEVY